MRRATDRAAFRAAVEDAPVGVRFHPENTPTEQEELTVRNLVELCGAGR